MKRDSTIPRVFALERDEIINLVFASLGVVSSSHLKLDRLLANIFEKKQHKLLSSMMKGNTLLGETKAKQKAYLMGQLQLSSSDAVPLENLFSLSTILKLRLVRLL